MTTTACPTCGQHLPLCPVCLSAVLPTHRDPRTNIAAHQDSVSRDCKGAGLPYHLTRDPRTRR